MQAGEILVADHDGVYVIKIVGDVRLTLSLSFDSYIQQMLSDPSFTSVLLDLSGAEAVDSTTLGLMAKVAIATQKQHQRAPLLYSVDADINRLLESMGFDDIFDMVNSKAAFEQLTNLSAECCCLQTGELDEQAVKSKVLEAHRLLMGLNEKNSRTFQDLIKVLEAGEL